MTAKRMAWAVIVLIGCRDVPVNERATSVASSVQPSSYPKNPLSLVASAQCQQPEVVQCLSAYAFTNLLPKDIERLAREAIAKCFPSQERHDLEAYRSCLPLNMGTDPRNGRTISLGFTCTDLCPDQGYVLALYSGVFKDECCAVGGRYWLDWARGGVVGCVPPETPTQQGMNVPSCNPSGDQPSLKRQH